jgi:hypothetical protein
LRNSGIGDFQFECGMRKKEYWRKEWKDSGIGELKE